MTTKKKTTLFMSSFLMLMSCNLKPFDEVAPKFKLIEPNAYNSSDKVEANLNGVYLSWRNFSYTPGYVISYGGLYDWRGTNSDYYLNNIDQEEQYVERGYSNYYIMIQRANYLINAMKNVESISGLTDKRRAEVEAESRLQRAWAHWELLRLYGQSWDLNSSYGIVLNRDVVREAVAKPRNTVQECYDFILEDLNFAADRAPESQKDGSKMSRVTAMAIKAQVLLTKGDFAAAAEAALSVINNTDYILEKKYRDIYLKGFKSKEFLFSPYSWGTTDEVSDLIGQYFYYTDGLKNLADEAVGAPNDGDDITGVGFDPRFAFAHAVNSLESLPEARRLNAKYPHRRQSDKQGNSLHILRKAEAYLIYAEAKAKAGTGVDADAVAKLNIIRNRAGLPSKNPTTKADLLEAIRIETSLELFGEWSQHWHALVRYHKRGDINITSFRPNIKNDNRLVWPIPKRALEGNNRLKQNPGY